MIVVSNGCNTSIFFSKYSNNRADHWLPMLIINRGFWEGFAIGCFCMALISGILMICPTNTVLHMGKNVCAEANHKNTHWANLAAMRLARPGTVSESWTNTGTESIFAAITTGSETNHHFENTTDTRLLRNTSIASKIPHSIKNGMKKLCSEKYRRNFSACTVKNAISFLCATTSSMLFFSPNQTIA